ncbi:hypothetical protein SEA_JANUS_1 [Streptomyces phage Janus]|uniref:Uncharacterized protein n=1 Tax=Streptomyces phage Janus TaxID=2510525 RepID=A0A411CPR7_9CAUD|nr:hypothetical protein KGG75_gp01 [Streptomyces phage Janus]QAY15905.1 hypothetical protein SEA_JANUS_1 [Streptomyces phage Janus]QFG10669.1 hypothetical protein SEA_ANIMUS_1 [Streptomyces phage Animus]
MDNFDTGLQFALQVAGAELATEPPAPDTPLARVLTFAAEHGHDAVTEDVIAAAMAGEL